MSALCDAERRSMSYTTVLKFFNDLQDHEHAYEPGDSYPRKGYEPDAARIAELSGATNLQGVPLIRPVPPKKRTKAKE